MAMALTGKAREIQRSQKGTGSNFTQSSEESHPLPDAGSVEGIGRPGWRKKKAPKGTGILFAFRKHSGRGCLKGMDLVPPNPDFHSGQT